MEVCTFDEEDIDLGERFDGFGVLVGYSVGGLLCPAMYRRGVQGTHGRQGDDLACHLISYRREVSVPQ